MWTIQFESECDSFDCRVNRIIYSSDSLRVVSFLTLNIYIYVPVYSIPMEKRSKIYGKYSKCIPIVKWNCDTKKRRKKREERKSKQNKQTNTSIRDCFFKKKNHMNHIRRVVFCKHCLLFKSYPWNRFRFSSILFSLFIVVYIVQTCTVTQHVEQVYVRLCL